MCICCSLFCKQRVKLGSFKAILTLSGGLRFLHELLCIDQVNLYFHFYLSYCNCIAVVLRIAGYMVSPDSFFNRLGGLFCLYCLFETQIFKPPYKIYLSLGEHFTCFSPWCGYAIWVIDLMGNSTISSNLYFT